MPLDPLLPLFISASLSRLVRSFFSLQRWGVQRHAGSVWVKSCHAATAVCHYFFLFSSCKHPTGEWLLGQGRRIAEHVLNGVWMADYVSSYHNSHTHVCLCFGTQRPRKRPLLIVHRIIPLIESNRTASPQPQPTTQLVIIVPPHIIISTPALFLLRYVVFSPFFCTNRVDALFTPPCCVIACAFFFMYLRH